MLHDYTGIAFAMALGGEGALPIYAALLWVTLGNGMRFGSHYLALASHDLRQPIHSIGLFTACLRDANLGGEELRLVDNIDRSLHTVSQLFRSISDIYTLDNGKLEPQAEPVNLGALLQEVVKQNIEATRWAGVELRLHPCRHWVNVNGGLLTTMVQNLVSNAIKYASGEPVLIGVRRQAKGLAVVVYDKGCGIAAEHLPDVFKEFYRVRHARDKMLRAWGWACPSSSASASCSMSMFITGHEIERIRQSLHAFNISVLAKPVRPPELRNVLLEQVKSMKCELPLDPLRD
ncbi:hypothetical protein HDC32_000573 [Pseudomonas sp. JAI120]|nr:hypothetical protein [Pseudomonas sp. SJZ073]MBB6310904.1 hypothetical protein [Pseudomonas sp. JAI120]